MALSFQIYHMALSLVCYLAGRESAISYISRAEKMFCTKDYAFQNGVPIIVTLTHYRIHYTLTHNRIHYSYS